MEKISEVLNTDCLAYMKTLPDKYFGLTIADPPFAVKYARGKNGFGVTTKNLPTTQDLKWDEKIPKKEFFDELLRVSDRVIIWGGQYFTHLLPQSKCWLVWDKCNGIENKSPFADCELAWTNMTKVVKQFHLRQLGFMSETKDGKRVHPTQKPTELYEWLIKNYAKEGDIIFDPMMGSQSSRIAAHRLGFDYVGCELDKEYFDKGCERFKQESSQLSLF